MYIKIKYEKNVLALFPYGLGGVEKSGDFLSRATRYTPPHHQKGTGDVSGAAQKGHILLPLPHIFHFGVAELGGGERSASNISYIYSPLFRYL